MSGLKLNLGCGEKRLNGYINVDKYGNPDVKHDLETFPWPWADNSVEEIKLIHVLEHLGHKTDVYLKVIQEMYRVCESGAIILIKVPHFRHDNFFNDPTHVRVITPSSLGLFSQRINKEVILRGGSNTPLGLYLGVNLEITSIKTTFSPNWYSLHPGGCTDPEIVERDTSIYNNMIEEYQIDIVVIK
ncbi:hypothetical protein [Prochlorococcus sp. MIT 1300]|uniref:class I SAM-dependent methyltransferase n=1 Tax=Prochlorococcus sp. MIT 1300 TaxID=3096218 RepID=UPI002A754C97|nr:hypothetical protein [Prochlorococcus sp. MIT 1300]